MPTARLSDRGVIEVAGPDAADFLNRLLTTQVPEQPAPQASYAALLTPQGKVLADMLIVRHPQKPDGFLLDCAGISMPEVLKRFTLYKLRAAITLKEASDLWSVEAGWGAAQPFGPQDDTRHVFDDPRHRAIGQRAMVSGPSHPDSDSVAYHSHRISLGLAEGGKDFDYGSVFPHEINLDHVHGLDFQKGCYVGQEVVSRMEHRGTARNRIVPVTLAAGASLAQGTPLMAGSLTIGHLGSTNAQGQGLALLRIDRVEEAKAKQQTITAGGLACLPHIPDWVQQA